MVLKRQVLARGVEHVKPQAKPQPCQPQFISAVRYSARFTSNGGQGTEYSYCYRTIASSAQLNATGYFYVSKSGLTQKTGNINLITLNAGSTNASTAGLAKTAGTLRWSLTVRNGSETIVAYSTQTPVLNQWFTNEIVDWLIR